jgi:hypothetical protein
MILGPAAAGLLLARIAPTWLLAFDAASFAFLGGQAWPTPNDIRSAEQPIDAQAAESGFRLLRRGGQLGLIVRTWLFFFLYGPVETPFRSTSPMTCTRTRDSSVPTGRALVWAPSSRLSLRERSAARPSSCHPARHDDRRLDRRQHRRWLDGHRLRRRDRRAGGARNGPWRRDLGKVCGEIGDQTDQESRSAVTEPHLA